jgi:hypothetical protein
LSKLSSFKRRPRINLFPYVSNDAELAVSARYDRCITARLAAFTGDENASCAPAPTYRGSSAMQMRHRFRQSKTPEQRLAEEAQRLREQAKLLPPGALREEVLRKARQAETSAHMSSWLASPGLRSPA